ncbi:putative Cytochrome P450 [Seiridium unicorne]|uniref:Cytochrome P450 n=1 Tax=Seiridium unicorne TaxID=138068 RepID=A0ABR2VEC2_9PEZI
MENALLILALGTRFFTKPWLPLPGTWKRLGEACTTFQGHMADLYNQKLHAFNENKLIEDSNLMASLVRASQNRKEGRGLAETEVYGTMFVVNFAGHDTTAHLITFALFYLAANPSVQHWLSHELLLVLGDKPIQEWDYHKDFPRLKRCMAILYETLRVKTLVPEVKWTSNRTQTLCVKGQTLTIPPATLVIPSYIHVHNSPQIWGPDAEEWRPGRWIMHAEKKESHALRSSFQHQNSRDIKQGPKIDHDYDEILLSPPKRGTFLVSGGSSVSAIFRSSFTSDPWILRILEHTAGYSSTDLAKFMADESGCATLPRPNSSGPVAPDKRIWYAMHRTHEEGLVSARSVAAFSASFQEFLGHQLSEFPTGEWVEVRIFDFLKKHMSIAATRSVLGSRILDINPGFIEAFWQYEQFGESLSFGLPCLNRQAISARERFRCMCRKWYELADQEFDWDIAELPNHTDWEPIFGSRISRGLAHWGKSFGFSVESLGAAYALLLFGLHANTIPICTWMMMEVIKDPDLYCVIKEEISRAKITDGPLAGSLEPHKLASLPLLQSVYTESLRLHVSILVTRTSTQPVTISGYNIPKGSVFQAPTEVGHLDEAVWSTPDHPASEFWAYRHVKEVERTDDMGNVAKGLEFSIGKRSGSYFPFGRKLPTSFSDQDTISGEAKSDLHREIRKNLSDDNKIGFLSEQRLRTILTVPVLENELEQYDLLHRKKEKDLGHMRFHFSKGRAQRKADIHIEAQRIFGVLEEGASGEKTYLKIMAILILIERPARIKLFIDADICDRDLPLFECSKKKSTQRHGLCKKDSNVPLKLFDRWRKCSIERFEEHQWIFPAPFFGSAKRKSVPHYQFSQKHILPFKFSRKHDTREGGFGQVRMVEIPPDHHDFEHYDELKSCFAVKTLKGPRTLDIFKLDVATLHRFSGNVHRHLISLLATYEQNDDIIWSFRGRRPICSNTGNETKERIPVTSMRHLCGWHANVKGSRMVSHTFIALERLLKLRCSVPTPSSC